jgi:acyl-CoA thioester hydrolase
VTSPFRYLLRVRYAECDIQKIVFNARWGEYVDVAVTEYFRAIWKTLDGNPVALDCRLVRQVLEWKQPATFDDVIEARVWTLRVGTTSFTIATAFHRWPDGPLLVTAETVYVVVDPERLVKQPVPETHRGVLERGAPGALVDHAGAG